MFLKSVHVHSLKWFFALLLSIEVQENMYEHRKILKRKCDEKRKAVVKSYISTQCIQKGVEQGDAYLMGLNKRKTESSLYSSYRRVSLTENFKIVCMFCMKIMCVCTKYYSTKYTTTTTKRVCTPRMFLVIFCFFVKIYCQHKFCNSLKIHLFLSFIFVFDLKCKLISSAKAY